MISINYLYLLLLSLSSELLVLAQQHVSSEYNYQLRLNLSDTSVINEDTLSVNCTNCYVNGDLSLSAGSVDSLPDSNFSSLPFNFSQDWAAVVVEDFTAHFELDFSAMTSSDDPYVDAAQGIIPFFANGIGFSTGTLVLNVDWTFNPTIHASVNSSTPVNFSYGFEFTIPANSAVFVPLNFDDNSTVESIGFNETTITPLDYTSADPNENFEFQVSFRPEFKVALDAIVIFEVAAASIFADVPQLDVAVSQVDNVTGDCQPAPAGTSPDKIYSDLTYVVPTLGYDIGFEIDLFGVNAVEEEFPIGDNETLATSCLMYSTDTHVLVPVVAENQGQRITATGQVVALWVVVLISTHFM